MEHRFSENALIGELWTAMAHDVSQQIRSLNALSHSFWNQLKKEKDSALIAAVESAIKLSVEKEEDQSLKGCFNNALCFEGPAILTVYAPLIRKLRENNTEPALDFYIMVKAHLALITRVTQSFAGDPIVIQRANSLLQAFEKEVQEPHIVVQIPEKRKKNPAQPARRQEQAKKIHKPAAKARPMAKPAKILHRRSKPMAKKVSISRRRARR